MARIFQARTSAIAYTPVAGDVFGDVVKAKCEAADPPISMEEVAIFNWGTREPREIVRALVELVGCQEVDEADPSRCKLDPARGPGDGRILLPKVWKKSGLAYEKVHELKVKKHLPATAIAIASLDKWFLPGEESCDIGYAVEGVKERATRVDVTVYASNYAKATPTPDGDLIKYAYTASPDTPIINLAVSDAVAERSAHTFKTWKGTSEAAEGILKPRDGAVRHINAASSPYTVVARYFDQDAQKKAMLRMDSFWPRWSGSGTGRALVDDSLKFSWTLKDCPAGMQGQFQISDKDGAILWRQALKPAECANGTHTHHWVEGKPLLSEARMPYRLQIQVHTDKDTAPGLALAGMHTEVRIFCHTDTGTFGVDHEQETQVLKFKQAPWLPGAAPAEDSDKGRKLRLARAGYHPGPIADGDTQTAYKQAIREFQRDNRKPGTTDRLPNDGTIDADTRTAIAAQPADRRPLFADAARADITASDAAEAKLNGKAEDLIIWVDDRNFYTNPPPVAPHTYPNMDLGDYRGGMGIGDGKQVKDRDSICRPWIPLEVAVPLLRKADELVSAVVPEVTDASRTAVGPVRVDWTFRDLPLADNVDTSLYEHNRARPKAFLTHVLTALKTTHNGKDALNCPDTCGGIRGTDYHQAVFGNGKEQSLAPWKGFNDAGNQVVCSVTHDDLGQDAALVFQTHLGKAGAYFHPSIVAGDGYQIRAQVNFRDLPEDGTHPNWKTLRDRYSQEQLPQAHGPKVRLWRKSSLRGYFPWEANADRHWGNGFNFETQFRIYFEPAFVHIVMESTGALPVLTPAGMYPPGAGEAAYRTVIDTNSVASKGTNVKAHRYRPAAEIYRSPDYIWPWSNHAHLGINSVPPAGTGVNAYEGVHMYPSVVGKVYTDTWRSFRVPLISEAVKQMEQTNGVLRGYTLGEFRASPSYWIQKYYCDTCGTDQLLIELTAMGGSGTGEECRVAICAGHLVTGAHRQYTCNHAGCNRTEWSTMNKAGQACPRRCTGTLSLTSHVGFHGFRKLLFDTVTSEYTCNTCRRVIHPVEPKNAAGSLAGNICGDACPGVYQAQGAVRVNEISSRTDMMGLPAAAERMGGIWFFCTYGRGISTWAHEIGHTKHLQHGPGGGGYQATQHDSTLATVPPLNTFAAGVNGWDRVCLMGYQRTGALPTDLDRGYFCGKCILKLRGWIVETGAVQNNVPPGNVLGP